ncbi:hypothetical protein [Streptobacillus moniliformis]|uniref:hypothetical protein n=1 Tax=Streptobacillus moniliformis TaxID=34105 RepID=UPI0007E3D0CB|nr:hypothetical protein [Streptobacillus moniliformis]
MAVSDKELKMVLKLADEVTPVLNKIKMEVKETQKVTDKEMGKGIKGLGKDVQKTKNEFDSLKNSVVNFGNVIKTFLAYKGIQFIKNIGVYALKSASDMQELENVTQQVFGNMSKEVEEFAEKTGNAMGRSIYQMKKFASDYGAIAQGLGEFDTSKVKEMSERLSVLAVDIGSFMNIDDSQAFTALRGIFTGETEALKNIGIIANDTTAKMYALEKGYKKQWEQMSAGEKATIRYQLVLDRTKAMHGDAERTLGSLANQMKQAQANISNLAVSLGNKLEPATNGVVSAFNKLLSSINKWVNKKEAQDYWRSFIQEAGNAQDKIQEYVRLSKLANENKITNEEEEKRLEIYKQLKGLYPDILGNISSEAKEYEKVARSIDDITLKLKQKVLAQLNEDSYKELIKKKQEALEKMGRLESEIIEKANEIKASTNIDISDKIINEVQEILTKNFINLGVAGQDEHTKELKQKAIEDILAKNGVKEPEKIVYSVEQLANIYNGSKVQLGIINQEIIELQNELQKKEEATDKLINGYKSGTVSLVNDFRNNFKNLTEKIDSKIEKSKNDILNNQEKSAREHSLKNNKSTSLIIDSQGKIQDNIVGYSSKLNNKEIEEILINRGTIVQFTNGIKTTFERLENGKIKATTHKTSEQVYKEALQKGKGPTQNLTNTTTKIYTDFNEFVKKTGIKFTNNVEKPKRLNDDKKKEKQLNKWEQLEQNLKKVDFELSSLVLDDKLLNSIKKSTTAIRNKELQNLDKLKGIVDLSEILSEKLKIYDKDIKSLEELLKANHSGNQINKIESIKKEIQDLKVAKEKIQDELDLEKSLKKEKNLIENLKNSIKEINFRISESNSKEYSQTLNDNIDSKINDIKEEQDKGYISINESISKQIEVYKSKLQSLKLLGVLDNEDIQKTKIEIEKLNQLQFSNEAENLYKKKQELLIDEQDFLQSSISSLEKEIQHYIQIGNFEKARELKYKKIIQEIELIESTNEKNQATTDILNKMRINIEGLSKIAIEMLDIQNAKKIYEDSFSALGEAIKKLPKELRKQVEKLDFKSENIKVFDDILNDEKLNNSSKEMIKKIRDLFETTKQKFKEAEEISKKENLKENISKAKEYISEAKTQIMKLAQAFGDSDLTETLSETIDMVTDLGMGIAQAFAGDIEGAVKSLLNFVTSLASNLMNLDISKQEKKAKEEFEKKEKEILQNTIALKELKDSINTLNNSILKQVSLNTNESNLKFGKEYSKLLTEAFAKNFNPNIELTGVATRRAKEVNKTEAIVGTILGPIYWLIRGIHAAASIKNENVSYSKKFNELFNTKGKTSDELKEIYNNEISKLKNEDLKKFLDKKDGLTTKWDLTSINSNLDDIKKMYLEKIKYVEEQEKKNRNFERNAILESFDGYSVVDLENKRKEMIENFKKIAKDDKELMKTLPEFEKKVDELLKGQEAIITAFDESRNKVISNLSNGNSAIESLTNGLQGYFNKLRSNMAKVLYDLDFRNLGNFENILIDKFKKISNALADLRIKNKASINELEPKLLDFKDVFKQLKNIDNTANKMNDVILQLRKQAKSEGISESLIDEMLPLSKINEKTKQLTEMLRNSLTLALDTSSLDKFSMSFGDSLYKNMKEKLIKAVVESTNFQNLYSKYLKTENIEAELSKLGNDLGSYYKFIEQKTRAFEDKLRAEGLSFRDTNGTNGETLQGGLSTATNNTSNLSNPKVNFNQNINIYNNGFMAEEILTKLSQLLRDVNFKQEKLEVSINDK